MKNEATKRYQELGCDIRTITNMEILFDSLLSQHKQIQPSYYLALDLIADNYNLLYMAKDDIMRNGLRKFDQHGREAKNECIQIFNQAQKSIRDLLNNFGNTPMSKSKIKSSDNEISTEEYLNALTQ